ncbi:hypothetical protein Zm00014a_008001 [Zea mays]|uniref:Myb/SANT-like domain-containing protein n=1 Tax=Zea mays TaxID=4577 RepID=A0A3L6D702_MAIZE|nr:hypothetical protein Zm00014a_008001 [Zea mays]
MARKGSPRFNMSSSPKLRRFIPTTIATKKGLLLNAVGQKEWLFYKRYCVQCFFMFSLVKQRADWNPGLERSLVNILHEFKDSDYRGDNGWNSEGWNRMVKEFHVRNKYVSFTKARIQDKEGQLKRVYKMLKAARQHSGSSWNEKRNLVEGPPTLWENLMVKFNNNKATFPLFDDLGEPYDRHLAEGTWSCTSLEAPQEEELNEQLQDAEDGP